MLLKKNKQEKLITFIAKNKNNFLLPNKPDIASKFIPTWYKNLPSYRNFNFEESSVNSGIAFDDNNQLYSTQTLKRCPPVQDYLNTGYIIPLWTDLLVNRIVEEDVIGFNWTFTSDGQVSEHPLHQVKDTPIEKMAMGDSVWKLINPWLIKTPPGYSCMFIPPLYHQSDFEILPGIVDTDVFHEINFPFTYRRYNENLENKVYNAGLPLVHIIPFKRDNWNSEHLENHPTIENFAEKQFIRTMTKFKNAYRSMKFKKIFK